jgi:hypothetical protein
MPEYPKALTEYITEQESEGSEIFTTFSEDETIWLIVPKGLENWIIVVSWTPGFDEFFIVNITGRALDRFEKVIAEVKQKEFEKCYHTGQEFEKCYHTGQEFEK